jgi:GABA permease
MLFVLAARREAPGRMLSINRRGVPMWAILSSTVVGFACVIADYVAPDTVFLFLLNSSGAVILFVYLLICLSQLRLRRRTPPERLRVKMWFHPVLTVLTAAAIVAVLVSMFIRADTRSQIILSLVSWAVVLVRYVISRKAMGAAHLTEPRRAAENRPGPGCTSTGPTRRPRSTSRSATDGSTRSWSAGWTRGLPHRGTLTRPDGRPVVRRQPSHRGRD